LKSKLVERISVFKLNITIINSSKDNELHDDGHDDNDGHENCVTAYTYTMVERWLFTLSWVVSKGKVNVQVYSVHVLICRYHHYFNNFVLYVNYNFKFFSF
jgi:hypothetical protein